MWTLVGGEGLEAIGVIGDIKRESAFFRAHLSLNLFKVENRVAYILFYFESSFLFLQINQMI